MSDRNLFIGLISNLTTKNFEEGVVDTDINLTTNSDNVLPTQKAVKSYVNNSIAGITGGLRYKGVLDASNLGTQLNNSKKGDLYKVSVAGIILTSLVLSVGDMVIINKDVVGTPTINDLDVIDNSENINNPIPIDPSVNILNLPNGYYVSEGTSFSTTNGYPWDYSSSSNHNTIIITGTSDYKIIQLISSNYSNFFYQRQQKKGVWGSWIILVNYIYLNTNRNVNETYVVGWGINSKQIYNILCAGNCPTNTSITLKAGLSSSSKLISFDGWVLKSGTNMRIPVQSVIANLSDLNAPIIYQDTTTGSIYLQMNNPAFNGQAYEISLYYTK